MNHYVIIMRDADYWLVGPFSSQATAAAWGGGRENNPEDDPRWQTIRLDDPSKPVRVVSPAIDEGE